MSIFRPLAVTCPACSHVFEIAAVESVNADRRSDLRDAIIAGTFQVLDCPECSAKFRLDPMFNYLDVGRGQWFSVQPLDTLGDWIDSEDQALATFALAYGDQAPPSAAEIGRGLKPRLVFGWAALREKLVAAEHQLDDVVLEMLKLEMVDGLGDVPLAPGNELRFENLMNEELLMNWVEAATDRIVEPMLVPRKLYDDIVADPAAWAPVRQQLETGPFVDMQKLFVGQGRA